MLSHSDSLRTAVSSRAEDQDDPLGRQLGVLEPGLHQVGVEAEHERPPAAEELVLVAGVVVQLVAQVLHVEQVRPQVGVVLHVRELRVQQALDAPLRGDRREAADRVGVLVEDARRHLLAARRAA